MGVEALLEELLECRGELAARVVTRIRDAMPESYAGVPEEEQRVAIEASLEMIIRMRLEGREPDFGEGARMLREMGEHRARQGVPVDDLLRAWRIGIEETTSYGRELAVRTDVEPAELFDLLQQALSLADEAMVSSASAHRLDSQADSADGRRGSVVRGALLGRLGPAELHAGFVGFALDPLVRYRAFRARAADGSQVEAINAALAGGNGGTVRTGLAAQIEQEAVGFACADLPRGEFDLVALGPECLPADLPSSYQAAGRVLAAAESFDLAGVHDLASAGLHAAVIENPDLGDALAAQFVEPVTALPGGEELLASVREWLGAGMRIDPAAERLFVHPNTVRYRLRRYEEVTGVELSESEDAFRVWWALHHRLAAPEEATSEEG